MCEAIDNLVQEERKEEAEELARKLFENGVSYEIVEKSIERLSCSELRAIYNDVMKNK